MPLTAAEWLSENSERQELAVMNIPLAMELYAAYVTSFVPDDVEKAIEQKYPIHLVLCQNIDGSPAQRDANEDIRTAARYGASLAGRMEAVRFLDSIRSYERESLEPIAFDERTTEQLYSLFKKESNG